MDSPMIGTSTASSSFGALEVGLEAGESSDKVPADEEGVSVVGDFASDGEADVSSL